MQRPGGSTDARLQGAIEGFDAATGTGVIAGPEGVRYRFAIGDLAPGLVPAVWQRVEFSTSSDGRAVAIDVPQARVRIDLGRVMQRTFIALGAHWMTFLGGGAILVGVPSAVGAWGAQTTLAGSSSVGMSVYALGTIGYQLGSFLLIGLVATAVLNSVREKSTPAGETMDTALRTVRPLLGLGVVATLGVFIGALFLIIPALVLSVWWSVSGVVLVAEGRGVVESLRRSSELTKGSRWPIFGLLVAWGLASWGLIWAATKVATALGQGWSSETWTMVVMIIQGVSNTASDTLFAVAAAALYYELRTVKEGDNSDQMAAVFE